MKKKILNLVLFSTSLAPVLSVISCGQEITLGPEKDEDVQQVPVSFAELDLRHSLKGGTVPFVEEDIKEKLDASSSSYIEWRDKNLTFFDNQGIEKKYDNQVESFVDSTPNKPIKLYYKLTTKEQNIARYISKKVIEKTKASPTIYSLVSVDGEVSNILLIFLMIKFLRLQNELNLSKSEADIIVDSLLYKYSSDATIDKHAKMKEKLSEIKKNFLDKNNNLEYTLAKAKEAIQNKVPDASSADLNKYAQDFADSRAGLILIDTPEKQISGAPADGTFAFFDQTKNTFVNSTTLQTGSPNTLNLYIDGHFDNVNLKKISIYIAKRIDEILSRDQNNIFYEKTFVYNIFDFISVILNAIVWEDKAQDLSKITKTEANVIAEAFAESNSTRILNFNQRQATISKILRDIKIQKVTRSQDFIFRWQDAALAIIEKIMP